MDFRNTSRLFADPAFDGKPEVVIDITGDDPVDEPINQRSIIMTTSRTIFHIDANSAYLSWSAVHRLQRVILLI